MGTELLLEQVGLEFTLEGVERQIWRAQLVLPAQTVPCPRSVDSEAAPAS